MMYYPVNHRNSVFKSKITMGRDGEVFGRLDCFKAAKTLVSFAAVIRVVTQCSSPTKLGRSMFGEERYVTTLITAVKETTKTFECCQSDGIVLTQGQIAKSK